MLVIAAGLYKETKTQSTIQAMILVLGGVVLGYFFGLVGVMAASCLSNLYRCIDLLFFIPRMVTHLPVITSLRRMIEEVLVILLIYCSSKFLFMSLPDSLPAWLLWAFANLLFAVAIALVYHRLFESKNFNIIINRAVSIFGGKR